MVADQVGCYRPGRLQERERERERARSVEKLEREREVCSLLKNLEKAPFISNLMRQRLSKKRISGYYLLLFGLILRIPHDSTAVYSPAVSKLSPGYVIEPFEGGHRGSLNLSQPGARRREKAKDPWRGLALVMVNWARTGWNELRIDLAKFERTLAANHGRLIQWLQLGHLGVLIDTPN